MKHLTAEQLLDLAEGAGLDEDTPHLGDCNECRRQVRDLRAARAVAAEASMPEPSPLFWDQLSARVRERVEADPADGWMRWPEYAGSWKLAWPVAAAAGVVLAVLLTVGRPVPRGPDPADGAPTAPAATTSDRVASWLAEAFPPDDPSLLLVADIIGDLDWDQTAEAGLGTRRMTMDQAATALDADERLELQRLLEEELSRTGA